jgi:lipoprotein-anchoring transpeptidase ErfK/SrfK
MHRPIKKVLPILLLVVLLAAGFSAPAQTKTQRANEAKRRLIVSLPDRRLALLENGKVKKIYIVAVGKKSTPSPTGTFTIMSRVTNPSYSHDGKVVAPGPGNPVGTRWMGLSAKGYGIHGTNLPKSIGKAASHGCIRMRKSDLEELFAEVKTGDEVEIIGQRDAEIAAVFGDTENSSTGGVAEIAIANETVPEITKTTQTAVAMRPGQ